MRDDEMMLGLNGTLHIVADDAGPSARRRHGASIGIGQRDLCFPADVHALFNRLQGADLSPASCSCSQSADGIRLGDTRTIELRQH